MVHVPAKQTSNSESKYKSKSKAKEKRDKQMHSARGYLVAVIMLFLLE